MRSVIFYSMVTLMVVWTVMFVLELVFVWYGSPAVAALAVGGLSMADLGQFYATARTEFWSITSGARVAVWALPMIVFAILSAVTQPTGR